MLVPESAPLTPEIAVALVNISLTGAANKGEPKETSAAMKPNAKGRYIKNSLKVLYTTIISI